MNCRNNSIDIALGKTEGWCSSLLFILTKLSPRFRSYIHRNIDIDLDKWFIFHEKFSVKQIMDVNYFQNDQF